jgi:hypothetical protein
VIEELKKNAIFRKALQEIKEKHRPAVPTFKPSIANSVDDWKFKSGQQAGFDLLYSILTGEINE